MDSPPSSPVNCACLSVSCAVIDPEKIKSRPELGGAGLLPLGTLRAPRRVWGGWLVWPEVWDKQEEFSRIYHRQSYFVRTGALKTQGTRSRTQKPGRARSRKPFRKDKGKNRKWASWFLPLAQSQCSSVASQSTFLGASALSRYVTWSLSGVC